MSPATILAVLAAVVVGALALGVGIYLMVRVFQGVFVGLGWLIGHLGRFIGGELRDIFRFFGCVLLAPVFMLFVLLNIVVGRWSAAGHFGRAVQDEFKAAAACLYRVIVGHPARLLLLTGLTDGLERRLPEVIAAAPGRDTPKARAGQFPGYTIVGSLAGGGSGGKLYIAQPDEIKRASFERAGFGDLDRVVIKAFSLSDGSSLPQIVRESRALDAAKKLGLVLEHELDGQRFHYVMRYVPGESLGLVTQGLHARSEAAGLDAKPLRHGLDLVGDLLRTLDTYHRGGLWHKDVKPDNIIVDDTGAHLVDFGLVTPLRSAMTLTTHGTEYFRDPELVRMALKGAKVHEVDGARFDIYAAGAVLYSVIENSFPAHGGLSQITKRCPDAVRWIIRRAMTDYDKRYRSAAEMLADVRAVAQADDPFALAPAELPSMRGEAPPDDLEPVIDPAVDLPMPASPPARDPADLPPAPAAAETPARPRRPRVRVVNWWTGKYEVEPDDAPPQMPRVSPEAFARATGFAAAARAATPRPPVRREAPRLATPAVPPGPRRPAGEQLHSARARVAEARKRAHERRRRMSHTPSPASHGMNPGVAFALFIFLGGAIALAGSLLLPALTKREGVTTLTVREAESETALTIESDPGATLAHVSAPAAPDAPEAPDAPDAFELADIDTEALARELVARVETAGEMTQERVEHAVAAFREALLAQSRSQSRAPASPAAPGVPPSAYPEAPLAGRTVLFIADEPKRGADADTALNECVPLELQAAGARVLDIDAVGGPDADDRVFTLLAAAAKTRGLRPLDNDDTARDLSGFVDAQPDIDLLVWIEPATPTGDSGDCRFIVADARRAVRGVMAPDDCAEAVGYAQYLERLNAAAR